MVSDDDMYDEANMEFASDDDVDTAGDDFIVNDDDSDDLLGIDKNYVVLSDDDIRRLMDDDITKVSSVLSVSKTEASALLRRYNWSVNKVNEEWFADESKVREAVGLVKEKKTVELTGIPCGICFDDYSSDGILAAPCGHPFCVECWQRYICNSISEGSGCLNLRCPEPNCKVVVLQEMIDCLISDEDKNKYYEFLYRSYVEENRKVKWCPAPGCNFAVEFEIGSDNCEVVCACSNYFCWMCTDEAHRPIDCDTVAKWKVKNNAESENTNWILAYTKPCPKCKKPIEKNAGCMRMTCLEPCKYQFCWLCLSPWSIHGYNPCNRYQPGNEDEKKKEMAKQSIVKYTHYYERWITNEKSRRKALEDLRRMEEVNVKELSELQCLPETQLKFITEAWKQIVECRRVLKWTYAYGFYLPDEEHGKRQFFEYLQGQAEAGLERLHHCAEKELESYLNIEEANSTTFSDFRAKLTGLTSVTKTYFENLVGALENGLEDVDSQGASDTKPTSSKNAGGSSRRMSSKNAALGENIRLANARTEKLMTLMRTRNARLPNTNNTASSKNAIVAGGRNLNGSNNLVTGGDNPLRNPVNLLEAGGTNFMRLRDELAAGRSYSMASQNLQQTGASSTISSNLQLAGGSKVVNIEGGIVTNLAHVQVARGRNLNGSNNLVIGGGNVTNLANTHVAGGRNLNGSNNLFMGGGNITNLANARVAGGGNLNGSNNLLIGGGNVTNLANAHVAGVRNLNGSNNLLIGAANVTNLANAHVAGGRNLNGSNNLVIGGDNPLRTPQNLLEAGGGNFVGLRDTPAEKRSYSTVSQFPQLAGTSSTTGLNNLPLTGGSNIRGGSVTNLANAHVAGSSNLTMPKTAHVTGSSSKIGRWKRHRTSNAGEPPLTINLDDDDDLGEADSATGAPLTQSLVDDLESWACDSCTFLNASTTTTCVICSEDASGSWECKLCTFVNKKHASTCQMCEHHR